MEEDFKIGPYDKSNALVVRLMLSLPNADRAIEKWNCKCDTIHPGNTKSFEIILILLTEVAAFYMRFTPIHFRNPNFLEMIFMALLIFEPELVLSL